MVDGPALLELRTLPQGSRGWGMCELYGRWARLSQCESIVVHDPYLVGVPHAARIHPACTFQDETFFNTIAG